MTVSYSSVYPRTIGNMVAHGFRVGRNVLLVINTSTTDLLIFSRASVGRKSDRLTPRSLTDSDADVAGSHSKHRH